MGAVLDAEAEHEAPRVMPIEEVRVLKPGDRIVRWWDRGEDRPPIVLTVVTVNQKTVTVENSRGNRWRVFGSTSSAARSASRSHAFS